MKTEKETTCTIGDGIHLGTGMLIAGVFWIGLFKTGLWFVKEIWLAAQISGL